MGFVEFLFNLFVPPWARLINLGIVVWNKCVTAATDLLVLEPSAVGGGAAWNIVQMITESIVYRSVAAGLAAAFFLYGISKSALDFGRNFDVRAFLGFLVPLCAAETVLLNFGAFVKSFFDAVSGLLRYTLAITGTELYADQMAPIDTIITEANLGFLESILMGIVGFVGMLVLIACGVSLILVVYNRFFKLLLIVPMGCFSLPAAAAGGALQHNPAWGYARTFIVYLMEALAILFSIYVCSALLADAHLFGALAGPDDFGYGILQLLDVILVCTATTAMAKGAELLMQRIFG